MARKEKAKFTSQGLIDLSFDFAGAFANVDLFKCIFDSGYERYGISTMGCGGGQYAIAGASALSSVIPFGSLLAKELSNANNLWHIFGNEGHKLGPLVDAYGSQEAAFVAVYEAMLEKIGKEGISGVFTESAVTVGDFTVLVGGNMTDEGLRIGTFYRP